MTYSPIFKIITFIGLMYTLNSINLTINKSGNLFLFNSENTKQCIVSSKNKKSYYNGTEELFLDENKYISNKKLITISPGGYKGFYLLGILTYLKENYEMDNFIFSGASAGAWNSLFMCYKGNPLTFVYNFLDINIKKCKSILELQFFLKYKLLSTHKTDEFDLKKLFIGVTTFRNFIPNANIYTDFEDLEDAINCCMASSHIPLITGGVTNRYKNMFSLDGGFSKYPYLNKDRFIHISLSMWDEIKGINNNNNFFKKKLLNIKNFSEFFSLSKNNLLELFDNGYQDAKIHRDYFDNLLDKKFDKDILEF